MRLFVAVETGPAIAQAAEALIAELRLRAGRLAPRARVTWILPHRLHLTLRFIGEVDEARAREVVAALERPLGGLPFSLTIGRLGTFPTTGRPRALWVGVYSGLEALGQVVREVTARVYQTGAPPEGRAFRPHLTLARVRDGAGLRVGPLVEGLTDTVLGTTRVEAITLFESRLSQEGPDYVPLRRTRLGQ